MLGDGLKHESWGCSRINWRFHREKSGCDDFSLTALSFLGSIEGVGAKLPMFIPLLGLNW